MRAFLEKLKIQNLPDVLLLLEKIHAQRDLAEKMESIERVFFTTGNYRPIKNMIGTFADAFYPYDQVYAPLGALAQKLGADKPVFFEAVFLTFARHTLSLYRERGIRDEIFYDTMSDFRIWIEDCRLRTGAYGLCEYMWLANHLRLNLFRLGRMQYQYAKFPYPAVTIGGHTVKKGADILTLHIPKGDPLSFDARMDSYRRAYEFFALRPMVVLCDSWLLYPGHQTMLRDCCNIRSFLADFLLLRTEENTDYRNLARLFEGRDGRDTSLQRAYLERIREHKKIGSGVGVFLFENDRCVVT